MVLKMNDEPSIDSNGDESFVVIERCTKETENNRSTMEPESLNLPSVVQNLHPNLCQQTGSSSTVSPGSSMMLPSIDAVMNMNSEEIQKRLQDLIKENADLKLTLQQHNLAMKQQFQTLKMWQDEVYKVHQTHKEKFEETKQFIGKIQADNKELKKALAEKPNGEVQNNEANSKLLAENAALQKQVNTLQEKLVASIQREKKIFQPSAKEAELNSVVEQLTRQLEVAERARRQLSIDVDRLTAQQSRIPPPLSAPIVMLDQSHENVQPAEQLKRYNEVLLRIEKIEDEMSRNSSMVSWMPMESDKLPFEVQELRKLLSQEQKLSASRKEAIGEIRQYFQRLLSDYQTLFQDWEWLRQQKAIKEKDAASEVQHNGYREKVDFLTAQIMECKETLNEKISLIESLKDHIRKLEADNECIEILKAQANVYQTDFEAERKSREELVTIKEKLAEDLRLLQRRNQQLIDDLKAYQEVGPVNGQQQSQRRAASHSPSPVQNNLQQRESSPSPPKVVYTCPNPDCNRRFDLYQPLERHVVQCLKLED